MGMRQLLVALISSLALLFFSLPAFAQSSNSSIPERNGDYPDPDHPGIRVRVFVHETSNSRQPVSSPVLACTDPASSAVVGLAGWKLPSAIWTYNLNTSSVPSSVGSGNLPTISSNGFSAWNNALASSSAKPTFTKGTDTTTNRQAYDGQNIVAWGRTSGIALAVTYTRYNSSTGVVVDVDTIFNQKFPWSWTDPSVNACSLNSNSYDAQDILTHELGHWMGLDDEYTADYQDNTMYGYGAKGEVKKDTLTSGDTAGVQAIYP